MAKYGLTPQGPNPKRLDVILEDMHSKMTERLGVNTRQNPQSLLNHTLTNVADEIAELWEFGVDVYHSQYTSSATGVSLDYAAQFGGSTREMAAKSYYSILCTGLDGTTIPAGTVIASDTNPATSLTATADATITRSAFNKATVTKTFTFTKAVTAASITLAKPMEADAQITLCAITVGGLIPADAVFKVEVTNNGKDSSPVWEDATTEARNGRNHLFTNQTAANGFAFNFRVTAERGASGESGYIASIQGGFQ